MSISRRISIFLTIVLLAVSGLCSTLQAQRVRYRLSGDWQAESGGWYSQSFKLPKAHKKQQIYLELDGKGFPARVRLNGQELPEWDGSPGPFGYDLTGKVLAGKNNILEINCEKEGLPQRAVLHCTDKLHQTLPLLNSLGTTGVYVWADDIVIRDKRCQLHVETQVRNADSKPQTFFVNTVVRDNDNLMIREFQSETITLAPGADTLVCLEKSLPKTTFWSWGYGYLYRISTSLVVDKKTVDRVVTTTGIRKLETRNGIVYLNDRAIQLKGYNADLSAGENPLKGESASEEGFTAVPWLWDWEHQLMERGNANLVRWTGGAPEALAVASCDRVGLMQAMTADANLMLANRNHPSVVFYECVTEPGNDILLAQMRELRNGLDPNGGRLVGAFEASGSRVAEYGGGQSMMRKSKEKPFWTMDYLNPSELATASEEERVAMAAARWQEHWDSRPGRGQRVSAGGLNSLFSAQEDAVYQADKVIWGGWVNTEKRYTETFIAGHWNWPAGTVKDVLAVSNAEKVELFVNGISQGFGQREGDFLFRFPEVVFKEGELRAIAYDANGKEAGEQAVLQTSGPVKRLKLNLVKSQDGFHADGKDLVLIQVEALDHKGQRCPLEESVVKLSCQGEAKGLAQEIQLKGGFAQTALRSTCQAGEIVVAASLAACEPDTLRFRSAAVDASDGLSLYFPEDELISYLFRGSTPQNPSFTASRIPVSVSRATAGCRLPEVAFAFDDNEATVWESDGDPSRAWMEFALRRMAVLKECCLKLKHSEEPCQLRLEGFYLDDEGQEKSLLLWEGSTSPSRGYITLPFAEGEALNRIKISAPSGSLALSEIEFYTKGLGSGQ